MIWVRPICGKILLPAESAFSQVIQSAAVVEFQNATESARELVGSHRLDPLERQRPVGCESGDFECPQQQAGARVRMVGILDAHLGNERFDLTFVDVPWRAFHLIEYDARQQGPGVRYAVVCGAVNAKSHELHQIVRGGSPAAPRDSGAM